MSGKVDPYQKKALEFEKVYNEKLMELRKEYPGEVKTPEYMTKAS